MNKLSAFVLTSLVLLSCSKSEVRQPEVKPLMEAVYASGFVVSDEEYQVFSQADGIVQDILQSEGSEVKNGSGLVLLESSQQDARYTIAKETYDLARVNSGKDSPILQEAENNLQNVRSKYKLDSLNFVRFSNLIRQKATTQIEFDRARLTYENSRNDLLSAVKRLERTRNDLTLALQQAENQWKIAAEESGNYLVRSKIDGMVFRITKEKGELVRRGELIAVVGKKEKFHLELSVDELDVKRVKVGQPVIVKIEAYAGQLFHGTLTKVFPLVDIRQQSLKVEASLEENLPGWFSGLAVEANIIIQQKENALVIPKSFLLPGDTVVLQTESGKSRIKIKKGIETLEEVEITEGLTQQSQLILPK